jgi:hypothetical protein
MFLPSQGVIFRPWNYKSIVKVIGFKPTCREAVREKYSLMLRLML